MSDILEQEIAEKRQQEQEELPVLTAQRFLNIFRQIHIFSDKKRKQFDQELLALPTEVIIALEGLPGASLLTAHIDELKGIPPVNKSHASAEVAQTKQKQPEKAPEQPKAPEAEAAPIPQKAFEPESAERMRIPFQNQPQPAIIDSSFAETLSQSLASALHQMEKTHSSDIKQLMEIIINSKKNEAAENKDAQNAQSAQNAKETTQQFSEALSMVMDSQAKMFSDMIEAQTKTISDILSTQNAQRAAEAAAISYVISSKNNAPAEKAEKPQRIETTSVEEETKSSVPLTKRLSRLFTDKGQDTASKASAPEETKTSAVAEKSYDEGVSLNDLASMAVSDIADDESSVDFSNFATEDNSKEETVATDSFSDWDSIVPADDMSSDILEETIGDGSSENKKKKKKKKHKNKKSLENGDSFTAAAPEDTNFDDVEDFSDDIASSLNGDLSEDFSAPEENVNQELVTENDEGTKEPSLEDFFPDEPEQTIYDFGDYEETPANDYPANDLGEPAAYDGEKDVQTDNIQESGTIALDDFKPVSYQEESSSEPIREESSHAPVVEEQNSDEEALQSIKTSLADFANDAPVSLDDWNWDSLDSSAEDDLQNSYGYSQQAPAEATPAEAPATTENEEEQTAGEEQNQDYDWEYAEVPEGGDDSEWEWEYEEVPEGTDDSEWEWEYEEVPEDDDNK